MKKLLMGCMAALAALISLVGCEQDRVVYGGPNYLMFSDTIYYCPVQETNEIFNVPVSATETADRDRTFAVEVIDKKSNAVEGKHYKILSNTVTIKAGERAANVEVEGLYENIGINDSLGFALRLIIPENDRWDMYGTETKVVLRKICPFDINDFTGHCKVTSSYFGEFMQDVDMRLITSEVVEGEENTIVLRGYYYDGYDIKIKFTRNKVLDPLIEMKQQLCASTGEAFGTIHGNGKLLMSQPTQYVSYYSTCEKFIFQYTTLSVDNKDGSLYGVVGTFANIIEWISEAEWEKLKDQGY